MMKVPNSILPMSGSDGEVADDARALGSARRRVHQVAEQEHDHRHREERADVDDDVALFGASRRAVAIARRAGRHRTGSAQ